MSNTLIAEVQGLRAEIQLEDFAPRAFGYNIELDGNISLTKLVDLMGRGGINYTVYTAGKYSWFPYLYLHLGYSIDTIITRGIKNTIKSLIDPKKASGFFKLSAGLSVNVSPFVAFRRCSNNQITPRSWEKWFMASSISAKLKAGIGFTFGGTYFAGADTGAPALAVLSADEALKKGYWWGASIDVGAGVGSPSIDITLSYASYYWLMDENRVYSWKKDGIEFGLRWLHFIKLRPDIVSITENIFNIKMPDWLKAVIRNIALIAQREKIDTIEDYYCLANKSKIDLEYKQMLANQGFTPQYFASLDKEDSNEYIA